MPKKTASKPTSASEPFSLIPKATQRALYECVSRALHDRGGQNNHNDVAEIAASMALRSSDVVVGSSASAGLQLTRETLIAESDGSNQFANSISAAVKGLCSAPSDAVVLATTTLAGYKESRHTLAFLGRTRLPLLVLTQTVSGRRYPGKRLDFRTVHAEFGIPVITVDANDAIAVYRVVTEVAHNSRVGRGPSIIEAALVGDPRKNIASPSPLECLESYMRRHGAWFRD